VTRSDDFDDAAPRSASSRDAWLFLALLLLIPLLCFAEWMIRETVGAADALECARTDCSAYQDTIRILYAVVPGLILLAILEAVAVGVRCFRQREPNHGA
jgi:hypothetical protein